MLKDYRHARAAVVEQGRKSGKKFVFVPDDDLLKMRRFVERFVDPGDRGAAKTEAAFTLGEAVDIYGDKHQGKDFPAGSYFISTDQPAGALANAVCEFDPHFKMELLKEERREREKFNDTRMYEVTAWSLPMAFDLEGLRDYVADQCHE